MPGEGGRQAWSFSSGRASKPVESGDLDPEKAAFLVAAKDVISIPIWINSPDPALWDKLVQMELEQMKIDVSTDVGCIYQFRVVAEEGARRQIEAAVLTPEGLERVPKDERWARYDLAAHFQPLPRDGMVFYREEGEWTLAFTKKGRLVYLHPLGRGPLDQDAIQEAFCLALRLREQGMLEAKQTIHLWDRDPQSLESARLLEQWFGVAVERIDPPEPVPDRQTVSVAFDPPEVARRRRRREQRTGAVRVIASLAAFYGVLVAGGWFYLHQTEAKIQAREAQLAALMPDATRIQQIQSVWGALKDSVEPDSYPWEIFHQCAVLLPAHGVRLTHFEVNGPRLVVRGEASTTAHAIQYRNALLNAPTLAGYQWESPKPEILPDGRAKFQAFGLIRGTAGSGPTQVSTLPTNETK